MALTSGRFKLLVINKSGWINPGWGRQLH